MDILTNDLSVHEQFHNIAAFRQALSRLMTMRAAARRFGRELYCNQALLIAEPIPGVQMQQVIGHLSDRNEQRAAMRWLTRGGPFWDDLRQHDDNDWLECGDRIVTDTAVGEAAFRTLHGVNCGLVSVKPSDWDYSPIQVNWRREAEGLDNRTAALGNWRTVPTLEDGLRDSAVPVQSWDALREAATNQFKKLILAKDCFVPLVGVPFAKGAAERFLALLGILDRFAQAFDEGGMRTAEGHRIYQDHFTGDRALFSDSSDSEKRRFRRELTFDHPEDPKDSLFCTWHGKVSHLMLRVHFSWPVEASRPVYVVYAGPKITRR